MNRVLHFSKGLYLNSSISHFLFANICYFLFNYSQSGIWLVFTSIFLCVTYIKIKNRNHLFVILTLLLFSILFFIQVLPNNQSIYKNKYTFLEGYIKEYDSGKIEVIQARLNGKLLLKPLSIDPGRIEFGYAKDIELSFLQIKGLLTLEKYKTNEFIIHLNKDATLKIEKNVFSNASSTIKDSIGIISDKYFKENSGLAKAMIFGIRDDISKDDNKLFRDIGLSHVLVASGANIIIIVSILEFIISKIRFIRSKVLFEFIVLFLYLGVVGIDGSIVRALLFFFVDVLSKYIGREIDYMQKLQITFFIIMIIFPSLVTGLSFILSMLACIAIKFSSDIMSSYNIKNKFFQNILQNFIIVLVVNILIAYYFHSLNLNGFISNILLLFFVEIIVIYGFSFAIAALILSPLLDRIFIYISIPLNFLFSVFIKVTEYLQDQIQDRFVFHYYISTEHIIYMYILILFIWWLISYKKYIHLDAYTLSVNDKQHFSFFSEA